MDIDDRLRRAVQDNYEKISGSDTFVCLFNPKMIEELIPLVQMGLAVYLDKPIVILVQRGASIPANLRAMATAVEEFDPVDPSSIERATERLFRNGHQ